MHHSRINCYSPLGIEKVPHMCILAFLTKQDCALHLDSPSGFSRLEIEERGCRIRDYLTLNHEISAPDFLVRGELTHAGGITDMAFLDHIGAIAHRVCEWQVLFG